MCLEKSNYNIDMSTLCYRSLINIPTSAEISYGHYDLVISHNLIKQLTMLCKSHIIDFTKI